tara:strand:- start:302 stop:1024 length:723 start_codon:yes stop_codon:yes gene_type:complete
MKIPRRRGKKAASHVGVVISFVIFITFLTFLYSILIEPSVNKSSKESVLESLKINAKEYLSSDLTTITIMIKNMPQACIRLNGLISDSGINSRIIVKNEEEEVQTAYVLSDDLEISRDNLDDVFFKIYSTENFAEVSSEGETPCNPTTHEKGLVRTKNYVSEKKVSNLLDDYETSYETLKKDLQISSGNEFGFGFIYSNKTVVKTKETPETLDIYAVEIPVQYFDSDAKVHVGRINLRVW